MSDKPPHPARIVYVVSLFPCWSETFIVREIATLIESGVDVVIVSLKPPSETMVQPEAAALLPRVLHPLPAARAPRAWLRALAAHPLALARAGATVVRRLWRQPRVMFKSLATLARGVEHLDRLRAFDADFVHAHWGTYPSTAAWLLADLLGKPFGFTCHAHDIFVDDQLLKEKIEGAALPVTISRYNIDWLAARVTSRARERLRVVHCGVDLGALPWRREGREAGLIVAVGRLDPIKGFDVLIEALALLQRSGRAFRCRIIGEGPQRAGLEAAIARHQLGDRVELAGARPQADVRAALYAAQVFALPSVVAADGNRDGIPVALMEAMAAGAPSVSTTVSGIPELIEHGQSGLLVAAGDARALADALARVLDDHALADTLASTARARIERDFDASREAHKLLALFGGAVDAA
ncbi:MAG: glycosyltransferase [Proteobacteria bacterium]|uniref:glycosyltransferase n=1 Tax=Rudaea sp. TaxID=2136325 RepID=UPI00321FA0AA|nr:glycosyltransferase [Pseudomonadota bacterium]